MNIIELEDKNTSNTYGRFPVQLVKGRGEYVWDESGREYIDLGSGIAVNTFGFSDPASSLTMSAEHCA